MSYAVRLGVLVTFMLVALGGCSKKLPPLSTPYAAVGAPIAPIVVQDVDGKKHTLKTPKNKQTIVALWATWCAPCMEEFPVLIEWHAAREDVHLLALNVDGARPDLALVQKTAGEHKLPKPYLYTTPGKASPLGLRSLPVVYMVDGDGIVRGVHEGFQGADELRGWLDSQTVP